MFFTVSLLLALQSVLSDGFFCNLSFYSCKVVEITAELLSVIVYERTEYITLKMPLFGVVI